MALDILLPGNHSRESGYLDTIPQMNFYWGEMSQERMRRLLKDAQGDFHGAVFSFEEDHPDLIRYILSSARAGWVHHCYSSHKANRVLDLGSGYGTLSFEVAKKYLEVWSLEGVRERVEFQNMRAGGENVELVRGNFSDPPFKDRSFDLIICNGVLEWVALNETGNPKDVQLEFLKKMRSKLTESGCLYIGIENRFGYPMIIGAPDHTNMPFTSLMPRGFADVAVKHFRKHFKKGLVTDNQWPNYRTYTYDWPGYVELLNKAGFDNIEVYWCFPSYNFPLFSGKIGNDSLALFLRSMNLNPKKLPKKILKSMSSFFLHLPKSTAILEYIWPEFLIYAYNGRKPQTLEDEVVGREPSFMYVSPANDPKYFIGREKDGRFARVVSVQTQVGRDDAFSAAVTYGRLKIDESRKQGHHIYTVSRSEGLALDVNDPKQRRLIIEWLKRFQKATEIKEDGRSIIDEMNELNAYAETVLTGQALEKTKEKLSRLAEWHTRNDTKMVSEHGDLFSGNVLVSDGQISVLDWEFFKKNGNPVFDPLFLFMCTENRSARGEVLRDLSVAIGIQEQDLLAHIPYACLKVMRRHDMKLGAPFHENFFEFRKKLDLALAK